MKALRLLLLILVLLSLPFASSNAACDKVGTTVVYINGIFGNESLAIQQKELLRKRFQSITGDHSTDFINGYNESHLGGLEDLVDSIVQVYKGGGLDYDLTTMLKQLHQDLNTQKLLIVGYSQGNFYANGVYQYLIDHGVQKYAMAVYGVGTPADMVAGNGNYLTSSTDKVINEITRRLAVAGLARRPLLPNTTIPLSVADQQDQFGGHSFNDFYLANAPDKIVADINEEISHLKVYDGAVLPKDGCFDEPETGIVYKIEGAGFTLLDHSNGLGFGNLFSDGISQGFALGSKFLQGIATIGGSLGNSLTAFASGISSSIQSAYGLIGQSSGESVVSVPQGGENNSHPTGNVVAIATGTGGPNTNPSNPEDLQDLMDDIQEKIDILRQQVNLLTTPPIPPVEDKNKDEKKDDNGKETPSQSGDTNQQTQNTGYTGTNYYPPLFISEVQVEGQNDAKQEYIELYNPNTNDVDLSGWYLQRKTATSTSWSSYATHSLLDGKKIGALGYFLIARTGYYQGLADAFTDTSITADNSFVLKDPSGDIIDKIGFGVAKDSENSPALSPAVGQTIGRKVLKDGSEQDTDNNANDFELQNATPRQQNTPYTIPIIITPHDTRAPDTVFTLQATQKTTAFAINFTITDPLTTASSSGVASYVFRWQKNSDAWQEDATVSVSGAPASFTGTRNFTGDDGATYTFEIKAKDVAGNESDWEPDGGAVTTISVPKKILINEIQSAGATDDKQEFVELYNPNSVDVSLTGWYLQRKTSGASAWATYAAHTLFDGKTIPALGYFLVARAEYFTDIADVFTANAITNDNAFALKDADGDIIDKVGFGTASDFETVPTVNPTAGKSIERKTIGLDTDDNSQDFRLSTAPSPKDSFVNLSFIDATDYASAMVSSNPGTDEYQLALQWQSTTPGVTFSVQYQENGGAWKDWQTNTSKTQDSFLAPYTLLVDDNYIFRAQAKDGDGNLSAWKTLSFNFENPVVINELWLGDTGQSNPDEWIELYNKSAHTVDLTGWTISLHNNPVALTGSIPAKGYYLLERADDNAVADVTADQVYTGASFVNSTSVILSDSHNRFIDAAIAPSGGFIASNFTNGSVYSLERISPYSFGDNRKNWIANNGTIINGKDRNGADLHATPKAQNSNYQLYTPWATGFGEDTTLPASLSPYVISSLSSLYVPKGVTLTIEPGTILKFMPSSGVLVDGTLQAPGDSANPIIFTSINDDTHGGDTNGDGSSSTPESGSWMGIQLTDQSIDSAFDHVFLGYAGQLVGSLYPAIMASAPFSLTNSTVKDVLTTGIDLKNSQAIIDNVDFIDIADVQSGNSGGAKAILVEGGSPSITNSRFTNNYDGIIVGSLSSGGSTISASPTITGNHFDQNTHYPVSFTAYSSPQFGGNEASGNALDGIILSGEINQDVHLAADIPYIIKNTMTVDSGATLTLDPGVIIEANGLSTGIKIDGTLHAEGIQDNVITFRPHNYTDPDIAPGVWMGLWFSDTSTNSSLDYVDISYAGRYLGATTDFGAAIRVDQSSISLTNSFLHYNINHGAWLINSPSLIDNTYFLNHRATQHGVYGTAVLVEGGSPEVKNSTIQSQSYGIIRHTWTDPNDSSQVIPATPELHTTDPDDPQKNHFIDTDQQDIYDLP